MNLPATPFISVIIPNHNGEKTIGRCLEAVHNSNYSNFEIIVVDDGSTDNTRWVAANYNSEIKNLKVIGYPANKGKGYALRQGVFASSGDAVLLTDADLSTPIEELDRLWPLISEQQYDVVIGSRALEPNKILKKQPWWRQGMGKIFNRIVKILVLDDFDDTQCGFKLFSDKAARNLFRYARVNRFAYDVEILALAKKKGYRISEVPVEWINSPASKVNPIFDSMQMLFDLIKIRMRVRENKDPSIKSG